jgi:type I restriction enzyme R subunit
MMPEAKARVNIDRMLIESGYVIQDLKEFNRTASLGVAVREFPTSTGPVDYLLFIDGSPAGVLEAKAEDKGSSLSSAADQSDRYMASDPKYIPVDVTHIRFAYESTGIRTLFRDIKDTKNRSREVYSFHRPETLLDWVKDDDTLRNRMKAFPPFNTQGFRDCQVAAILNLEKSFAENKPRALIQMATGASKTYTAITSAYRLLKYAKTKRILFLVDTKNLGEQAESEFMNYKPSDDGRFFQNSTMSAGYIHHSYLQIPRSVSVPFNVCTPFFAAKTWMILWKKPLLTSGNLPASPVVLPIILSIRLNFSM